MPICTNCSHPTPYLYTVYNTANNLRLEQCTQCHEFADPYVEHDTLTLILDLMLLKRNVYRHLLFNRGSGVRRIGHSEPHQSTPHSTIPGGHENKLRVPSANEEKAESARTKARWTHILKLGTALIIVDAFIRWTHLGVSQPFDPSQLGITSWNRAAIESFIRTLVGCFIETIAFHAGVTLACFILLKSLNWVRQWRKSGVSNDANTLSGVQQEFRYSHVPLTLLYSSLTKLFLLFLLSIWRPDAPSESARPLPPEYNVTSLFSNPVIIGAFEILDEDNLDREWIVRNVLGGMAAGFGLRVVLDCHPAFTTMVVLVGWAVKTTVAKLVSEWVMAGIDERMAGEIWLAYSIP
ncbi:unnamed protein product [Somion occarium]